jgi:hypothetical protein
VDGFLIALVVLTATGLIIFVFFQSSSRFHSVSASYSGCGRDTSRELRPVTPFSLLGSFDLADPGATLIWSTQVPALRRVCDHEPGGTPCASLRPIYVELARRYPEIYDGYDFRDWGQLLVDLNLFRVEATCVHITAAGRVFLERLVDRRP